MIPGQGPQTGEGKGPWSSPSSHRVLRPSPAPACPQLLQVLSTIQELWRRGRRDSSALLGLWHCSRRGLHCGQQPVQQPVSGSRLSKPALSGGGECHISSNLPRGSHVHLPFHALAKVWRGSARFHRRCLKPGELSGLAARTGPKVTCQGNRPGAS